MTSETPEQEKISPSKNPLKPPLELALSLIVIFIGTLGVILLGYLHGKMSITTVIGNWKWIYKAEEHSWFTMGLSIDNYERELLIETLEYRLESDDRLIRDFGTKEDLTYLLERISDEYL